MSATDIHLLRAMLRSGCVFDNHQNDVQHPRSSLRTHGLMAAEESKFHATKKKLPAGSLAVAQREFRPPPAATAEYFRSSFLLKLNESASGEEQLLAFHGPSRAKVGRCGAGEETRTETNICLLLGRELAWTHRSSFIKPGSSQAHSYASPDQAERRCQQFITLLTHYICT